MATLLAQSSEAEKKKKKGVFICLEACWKNKDPVFLDTLNVTVWLNKLACSFQWTNSQWKSLTHEADTCKWVVFYKQSESLKYSHCCIYSILLSVKKTIWIYNCTVNIQTLHDHIKWATRKSIFCTWGWSLSAICVTVDQSALRSNNNRYMEVLKRFSMYWLI